MSKLYIAGPMSGIPQFNYPAFDAAAALVRGQGHEALSPAEMDDDATRAAAMSSTDGNLNTFESDETWGDFLSRDVKIVADECDGVVLLEGWEDSRGARLEAFIALTVEKPVYQLNVDDVLGEMDPLWLAQLIAAHVATQTDTERYVQ